MTVRVIDIETTGTDPASDAIIEIASVDLLKDGTITNQRSTLVQPPIPVPPESSAASLDRRGPRLRAAARRRARSVQGGGRLRRPWLDRRASDGPLVRF
jgi:hypothetical protein